VNGPASDTPAAPLPLSDRLMERWGIDYDAARRVLFLAPRVIAGEGRAECPRFRAGRTVVAVSLRVRPGSVACRVSVGFGPPIRVEVEPVGMASEQTLVDDVPVAGSRAAFEARGAHEVVWMTG
jgi:hypothetical protein